MRFQVRFRVRTLMILVLVVGLIAGSVVQIVRTRRTPYVPHGGGGGGNIWATEGGGVEIELSRWYFGADETASPIRWAVSITRADDWPPGVTPRSPLDFPTSGEPACDVPPRLFEAEYGTPSAPDPGKTIPGFSLPPTLTVFRGDLRKSLPLKLAPGSYYVTVLYRDGLKVRNKAGKIVDRGNIAPGGSYSQRVDVK